MFPTPELIEFLEQSLLSSGLWTYVHRDSISNKPAYKCNFCEKSTGSKSASSKSAILKHITKCGNVDLSLRSALVSADTQRTDECVAALRDLVLGDPIFRIRRATIMTCIGGYLKQVEEADANLPGTSSVRAVEKWLSTCQPSNLLNDTSAVGIHLVEASIVLTDGWLGAPTEDLLKVGLLQLATRAVGHLVSDPDSKWIDKTGQVYDLDESEKQVAIGSLIHSFISPTPKPEFLKSAAGNFSVMGIIQPNSLWCQHYSLDIPLSHPWCKLVPTGQEQSICAMAAGHETCLHADDFFSATVMQQVKGQKLWLIAPPTPSNLKLWTSARTSGLHVPMDRLLNELEGLKVFMAAPGDIIMYPEGYLHACVTLECSIHCSFSMGSKVFLVSRAKEVERMLEWMEMCEVDAGVVQGILNSYPSFASGLSSTTDELDGLLGIRVHDRMKAVLQRQRGSASTLMSTSGPSSSSATPQLPAQGISKNRRKN